MTLDRGPKLIPNTNNVNQGAICKDASNYALDNYRFIHYDTMLIIEC